MILARWFKSEAPRAEVRGVYDAIVAQARQPALYAGLGVPDTVSGRFDMIALHAFLVLERLKAGGEAGSAFAQRLTDELFLDMDRSLREMGVGDLSVGKKVRSMAEVFYGRLKAYAAAGGDDAALTEALRRNVYAGADQVGNAERLTGYARAVGAVLAVGEPQDIMAGRVDFGDTEREITEHEE